MTVVHTFSSMSKNTEFWFHFGGYWRKNKRWCYDGWDMDIVKDHFDRMTYDRIVKHFSELGFSNPKNIYVRDPEKIIEEGLYLIKDAESCRKVMQYMDILEYEKIELFIDHDIMPMPDINPCQLFVDSNERKNSKIGMNSWNVDVEGLIFESGDHRVEINTEGDMGLVFGDRSERMGKGPNVWENEMGDDYHIEDDNGGINIWDNEEINFVEGENVYVSPIGYASEGENDSELDEEDDSDSETETGFTDIVSYSEPPQGCFRVGLTFANAQEARDAINEYGVKYGYKLKFEKNEKTRVRVGCMNSADCPFKLLVSVDGDRGGLAVKTSIMEHKCFQQMEVPSASQGYIAKYFKDQVYRNPKFRATDMQAEMEKHLKTRVSVDKCKRAKRMIINQLEGSFKHEFAILFAYAHKIKESNPGSKCEIQLSDEALKKGKRIFRRIFVCFDACKKNWSGGCRPLIGLDGCFLKGVCPGMLLTAVGKDGNDQVVPIAWAVVNKENKDNWRWFLCWLRQELELKDGTHITIMSDMQKVNFLLLFHVFLLLASISFL